MFKRYHEWAKLNPLMLALAPITRVIGLGARISKVSLERQLDW